MDRANETPMTELKPLAYGYMRVPCDVPDHAIRELELNIKGYAEQSGFCFATIFHELQSGWLEVWDELTTELQRADCHCVIVPSLNHVSPHPLLRLYRLDELAEHAKVDVLELSDR